MMILGYNFSISKPKSNIMFDLNYIGKVKVDLSELTKEEFLKLSKESNHDGKGDFHIFFAQKPEAEHVKIIFSHFVSSSKIKKVIVSEN